MADLLIESIGDVGRRVARNVADMRAKHGLSLAELSRRTGGRLNELALRRIERLARRVDVDDLLLLADALDVEPLDLLGDRLAHIPESLPEAVELLKNAERIAGANRAAIDRAVEFIERAAH